MRIGEIILQRRKELGMTQKQLAEMLNVTDRSVSRWECGVNLPDVETLKTIAKVLDVPITYFYEDVEEKEINYTEEYDYEKIKKFKLKSIPPIILLIISFSVTIIAKLLMINTKYKYYYHYKGHPSYIFSVYSNMSAVAFEPSHAPDFKIALTSLIISVILITISLVLYSRNSVEFKCFYKEKMFQSEYTYAHKQSRMFYILWLCIAVLMLLV